MELYTEKELEYYMQEAYNMGQEDLIDYIDESQKDIIATKNDTHIYPSNPYKTFLSAPVDKATKKLFRSQSLLCKNIIKFGPCGKRPDLYRKVNDIRFNNWLNSLDERSKKNADLKDAIKGNKY